MTYDQLCDEGMEQERQDRLARAEAIINKERGNSDSELIAAGDICRDCGEPFHQRQGAPSLWVKCGGSAPVGSRFVVEGRYYSSEADAAFSQRVAAEKRARLIARIAQYERRSGTTTRGVRFAITPVGSRAPSVQQGGGQCPSKRVGSPSEAYFVRRLFLSEAAI